jgi:hypothetical protein
MGAIELFGRVFFVVAMTIPLVARAQETRSPSSQPSGQGSDDARERAHDTFVEATAAHARGEYQQAARLFEEAYRILPRAAVKFNAGISWDLSGDLVRAADAYEAALDMGGLEEDEARDARERLGALKRELGYVSVDEPVGAVVTVAHVERAPIPVRLHVMPGTYEVHVESGSRTADRSIHVAAGEVVDVRLQLSAPPPVQAPPQPKPVTLPPLDPRRERPEHRATGPSVWSFVGLGGAAALSGLAVFLGVRALEARDAFESSGRRDVAAHDRASTLRTWTNVAWGGAAVSGGAGLYFLLATPQIEL